MARALTGAWRSSPPIPELSQAALNQIARKLLISRAGALAWWGLRHSELRTSQAAIELCNAYRLCTLKAALHERNIELVFAQLRSANIEPILIKGWAIARLYPEPGLRPYGDIDLCVRDDDLAAARAALKRLPDKTIDVDLVHPEIDRLGKRSWQELYPRTHLVRLGQTEVRVPGPEDHLRILCIHMLKGPRMSPVLLCDIALMLETIPEGFDWKLCLGNRPESDWIACAIGLAHHLLGVPVAQTPIANRARNLPKWLVSAVLKHWADYLPMEYMAPLTTYLRHPKGITTALRIRWPSPIESSLVFKRPFSRTPPLPYQLGYFFSLRKIFINQLLDSLRQRSKIIR
jgi:Uncharacterised nucleotidyltransferase